MIFVTLGSQKFQFNRLLKEIDNLIENRVIEEKVFAQTGASDYKPINYDYKDFLEKDKFEEYIKNANFIITHAGTGAIINSLKNNKKVIAIPRLAEFGEHVDDHQIQLINEFKELNFIEPVYEIEQLGQAIKNIKDKKYNEYISNTKKILDSIENFIEEEVK